MKLLVVTEFPPNASGGGPAVVRQMLKDWPSEKLFWWSCMPETDRRFNQRVQGLRCAAIPGKFYPQQKFTALKSALLEHVWSPWAEKHLRRTLRELQPDAVWVIPHNWSIPPIRAAITEANQPCHVSLHDYVDVHGNPRRFGVGRCARLVRLADEIYAGAASADAISREMADDLEKRTGKVAAAIIRFGVEPAELAELATTTSDRPHNEIRIAYAGSILVEKEFALFVTALRKLKEVNRRPIRLRLFGANPFSSAPWFDASWMSVIGNLPEAELRAQLRQCHWGFSPMALADADPRYNRFSFPTKFIAYLAAGLPVITLGHPESSVMKMAARYDVGFSTSATDVETLAARLQSALAIAAPEERHGQEIIRCARSEFDAAAMRGKLYECIRYSAARRP